MHDVAAGARALARDHLLSIRYDEFAMRDVDWPVLNSTPEICAKQKPRARKHYVRWQRHKRDGGNKLVVRATHTKCTFEFHFQMASLPDARRRHFHEICRFCFISRRVFYFFSILMCLVSKIDFLRFAFSN